MPKMVQEMNFPDVSYCQNNWDETPKMVQYRVWLMGFDDNKNICTMKTCHMLVQMVTTTWSVKQDSVELSKV